MALILRELFKGYYTLFNELSDPRANDYFLMSSPFHVAIVLGIYMHFVYISGPKFMNNRPAYSLDRIIMVFNVLQIIVNSFIFVEAFKLVLNYNWTCQPVDHSSTPDNNFIHKMVYVYFLNKISDLFDTVFFVLRKKMNQITFLHVYHHFGMVILSWIAVKFVPGGHSVYMGLVNCLVHGIMYLYYFLTVWRPEYKNSVWWKKHLTQLQLAQFLILIVTFGQLLFREDCGYPKIVSYGFVPQNVLMIMLFGEFYINTYVRPQKIKSDP